MRVSLIVAADRNGVIGRDGDLPWRLSSDLKRFRALTSGHHLLLGRKTWESIGRPLPERRILVLSRGELDLPEGVERVGSFEEAVALARGRGEDELFVGGGAAVYALALPRADRIHWTRVEAEVEGDTRFPAWDPTRFERVREEAVAADERNDFPTRYQVFERRQVADPLAGWHRAIEAGDARLLTGLLHPEVVFHSPVVHTPQEGREITLRYLGAAAHLLVGEHWRYVGEWRGPFGAVLEFETRVGEIVVNGVDILRWDEEGRLVEIKVMVRPARAMEALQAAMQALLAG